MNRIVANSLVKRCASCDQILPLPGFYYDSRSLDGLTSSCRSCAAKYRRSPSGVAARIKGNKKYRKTPHGRRRTNQLASEFCKTQKGRYNQLRCSARTRRLECSIEFEDYKKLVPGVCHYCQGPLSDKGHGLDRMDSGKGYHIGNVVPCCGPCNQRKNKHTYEWMMERVSNASVYLAK